MQLAFTIPTAGRVRIESFDVTGRRAGVRDVDLAAGFQVLPVPFARAQSPGIYALRVTWRGQSLETRAVVTR
jgi:hypothetical protein